MGKRADKLPPKLEAVLALLCKSVEGELNVTQAVKLPYLVDVVANNVLGHPITEGKHQAWKHGVVTAQAWKHLDRCEAEDGPFLVEPVPFSEERKVTLSPDVETEQLTPEEERIVRFVADVFQQHRAGDLGRMTKLMNPRVRTWGGNKIADLGPDAFERMTADYQEMAAAVACTTLDSLRRESKPIESIEDVIA